MPAAPSEGAAAAALPLLEASPVAAPPSQPTDVRSLSPDGYRFRFTASARTCASFERAKDLLADAVPNGDTDAIIGRALSLLVRDLERRRFAATDHPRASRGQGDDSRDIPAAVQREVWERDGGRCAFVPHPLRNGSPVRPRERAGPGCRV
jgi:hypothetical protein